MSATPCLDGFPRHRWRSAGLDIIAGIFVRVRECPSCQQRQTSPHDGRPPRWKALR